MRREQSRGEDGFTLIEVLVTILLIGGALLALLALVDRGSVTTADNLTRENTTNVARELVERAHGVDYNQLTTTTAPTALRNALELDSPRNSSTVSGGQWTMTGRTSASQLTVSASACTVPIKSYQPIVIPVTDTFCQTASGGSGGTGGTTQTGQSGTCQVEGTYDPVLGLRVRLLVDINLCASGTLVTAVCTLLGPAGPLQQFIDNFLLPDDGAVMLLLNGIAPGSGITTTLCGGRPVEIDPNQPSDINPGRRVTISVSGTSLGKPYSLTQTTLVPRPRTAA
ncbi:MAG TPA: prepilin-type N-terminal cleavage/methylation domain-containing protein [Solirubrobacteraceae bacterium]